MTTPDSAADRGCGEATLILDCLVAETAGCFSETFRRGLRSHPRCTTTFVPRVIPQSQYATGQVLMAGNAEVRAVRRVQEIYTGAGTPPLAG